MNRLQKAAFACLLALALLAAPLVAACGDCCPKAQAPTAIAAVQACCGDCAPSLEKTPDPASIAAQKAHDPDGAPRIAPPPTQAASPALSAGIQISTSFVSRAAPSFASCPLRL
jgi:hypothetical protein